MNQELRATKNYLVFTDLDGSLLDHFSYSFAPAEPALLRLKENHIPVIPTTSKTKAELLDIRKSLGNTHPFIIENGAAVYIPKNYFPQQPADSIDGGEYWVRSFSKPRSYWLKVVEQYRLGLKQPHEELFKGFSELGVLGIVALTGLSEEQAEKASQREYSEPIKWLACEEARDDFIAFLVEHNAKPLIGGRFLHVSGDCDKGRAMRWLQEEYNRQHVKQYQTIALGDSYNDIDMLEAADNAILIPSPAHSLPGVTHKKLITPKGFGPEAWANGIEEVLESND